MTKVEADAIYEILINHAGAHPDGREDFVFHQTSSSPPKEYRFMGGLGFGGKFWNYNGKWYVTTYPEDTVYFPSRIEMVNNTNAALSGLRASFTALEEALDD